MASQLFPNINKLDDVSAGVRWMLKGGLVDTVGFAKHFPHTSQDLQKKEKATSPEAVLSDLKCVYEPPFTQAHLREDIGPNQMCGMAKFTTNAAFPKNFFRHVSEAEKTSILDGFSTELFERIKSTSGAEFITDWQSKPCQYKDNWDGLVKECVDQVCQAWAERLDKKLFRGKRGTFLKKCPLYDIEPRKYYDVGMPLNIMFQLDPLSVNRHAGQTKSRIEALEVALKNVAVGNHDIPNACWECGITATVLDVSLKQCSKCKVALYCSQDCQIAAWRGGHKRKCQTLSAKHAAYKESFDLVEKAHKEEGGLEEFGLDDFTLKDYVDYSLAAGLLTNNPFEFMGLSRDQVVEILGEPSMEHFYTNLGRVVRGKWWYYDQVDELLYEQLMAELQNERKELEESAFLMLAYAMCFDLSNEKTNINFSGLMEERGVPMPPSHFLKMYQRGKQSVDSNEQFRVRRDGRLGAMAALRGEYHK